MKNSRMENFYCKYDEHSINIPIKSSYKLTDSISVDNWIKQIGWNSQKRK
jgi:hypothetical protein